MRSFLLLGFLICSILACSDPLVVAPVQSKSVNNDLLDFNKGYIAYESNAIDTLLSIKNWDFNKSKTGLRYQLNPVGCSGYKPHSEDLVRLDYQISDIHDNSIYSITDTLIHLEKDYTVNGLVEGVKMMCKGSSGTFILPSYLAYDVKGDMKKIGPREVLIYRVKINNVIKNTKND